MRNGRCGGPPSARSSRNNLALREIPVLNDLARPRKVQVHGNQQGRAVGAIGALMNIERQPRTLPVRGRKAGMGTDAEGPRSGQREVSGQKR